MMPVMSSNSVPIMAVLGTDPPSRGFQTHCDHLRLSNLRLRSCKKGRKTYDCLWVGVPIAIEDVGRQTPSGVGVRGVVLSDNPNFRIRVRSTDRSRLRDGDEHAFETESSQRERESKVSLSKRTSVFLKDAHLSQKSRP